MGIKTIMDLDDYWLPGKEHPIHDLIIVNKIHEKIIANLKEVEYVLTTTPVFAKEITKYNKNVFVFPNAINPNVEIFDIKSNKIVGNELVKSTFQTDSIVPYKKKKNYDKDRYSIESGCYGPIYYNELRHEYYRVFYHALPQKNEKNEFTIYEDKSSSILVLDEDLKLKKEVFFKKGYFHFFGITGTENGFLLNQINGDGKNCFFVEINLKNKS